MSQAKEISALPPTNELSQEVQQPQMELENARKILERIVGWHESKITDITDTDTFAGESIDTLRLALYSFSLHLLDTHETKVVPKTSIKSIEKPVGRGEKLQFTTHNTYDTNNQPLGLGRLELQLMMRNFFEIEFAFPVIEPQTSFSKVSIRYADNRYVPRTLVFMYKIESVEEYQMMARGLRWLCANMLAWDENGVILPEDLNQLQLPDPSIPSSLA